MKLLSDDTAQCFEGKKAERGGERPTFSHTNEKALVCAAGAPRSCILSSLQTFYHKLYITWANSEWESLDKQAWLTTEASLRPQQTHTQYIHIRVSKCKALFKHFSRCIFQLFQHLTAVANYILRYRAYLTYNIPISSLLHHIESDVFVLQTTRMMACYRSVTN